MTTKPINCVEMVEAIQEKIQERLEAMSLDEQVAYWRVRTDELRRRQRLGLSAFDHNVTASESNGR